MKEKKGNARREKTWRKGLMVFLVLFAMPFVLPAQSQRVLLYNQKPTYEDVFRGPFEVMALYTKDGRTITITSEREDGVWTSTQEIEFYLELISSDLESVDLIVHNHPTPHRWSAQDRKFYDRLKREGFKGRFVLYFPWSGSVRFMEGFSSSGLQHRPRSNTR